MSWIKMRTNLHDHPKVVRMAGALKLKTAPERLKVIGGLWRVWITFDEHSVDGVLEGYTFETMDETVGWRGFCEAMAAVKWLFSGDAGLTMPEFDEHNGQSAKRRAQDAKRKREGEDSDDDRDSGGNESTKRPRGRPRKSGNDSASDADELRKRKGLEEEEEKDKKYHSDESADFHSAAVTTPEAVCRALADAGIAGANPTDPLLVALVNAGAAVEEFTAAVPKARGKGNEWPYLLAAVQGRRDDAHAAARSVQAGPAAQAEPWHATPAGIKARGEELGLVWREDGWVNGEHMAFPTYRAKVLRMAGEGAEAAA